MLRKSSRDFLTGLLNFLHSGRGKANGDAELTPGQAFPNQCLTLTQEGL